MTRDSFKSKGPELLLDLAQHVSATIAELLQVDPAIAEAAGHEVAGRMAAHWGGQNVYFPMGLSYKLSKRDREIWAAFSGHNHSDLARQYGVSLQWIYKIVKAARADELARRQGDMFSTGGNDEPEPELVPA